MNDLADLADLFLKACRRRGILVVAAESCTGGLIMASLTDIPGSSAVVDRGFVTYSNAAKVDMVGVRADTLALHGAVSAQVAGEMAAGALARSRCGIALSVTGIAGPGGGSDDKPVGLVWFGVAIADRDVVTERRLFDNRGREFIRRETVRHALAMGIAVLEKNGV